MGRDENKKNLFPHNSSPNDDIHRGKLEHVNEKKDLSYN